MTSESRPRRAIRFVPERVDHKAWAIGEPTLAPVPDTHVSGVLDLVDLRSRRFRVRDDVGNDITLEAVGDAAEASKLIGSRIEAVGGAILGHRGQIVRLVAAHISGGSPPVAWQVPERAADHLDLSLSPPPDGIVGVTDTDVEAFLAMLHT
jgi:hypothetical protein